MNNRFSFLVVISIFFSFFLFQCGFSVFGPGEHISNDDGKSGETKKWLKLAENYYQNPDDEQRVHSKKILQNLIDYRWNDMTTREKFEVATLYSSVVFNIKKPSSVDFTDSLEALLSAFKGSSLTFENTSNMNFVNINLPRANNIHREVQPIFTRLIAYSNDITDAEKAVVYFHIGSALAISYADVSVNFLGNSTSHLISLKRAYVSLSQKVDEVIGFTMTLPATQAQYNTSTNELCTGEFPAVETEENKFGNKLTGWHAFLASTMTPEVSILDAFQTEKTSFFANISGDIEYFRSHFDGFGKWVDRTKQVRAGCQSGQFNF